MTDFPTLSYIYFQLQKSLPFCIPKSSKTYPSRVEPSCIGQLPPPPPEVGRNWQLNPPGSAPPHHLLFRYTLTFKKYIWFIIEPVYSHPSPPKQALYYLTETPSMLAWKRNH